jgi:hypothetical protein
MINYSITFHFPKNYGAFLQAFALQKKLPFYSSTLNFIPNYKYSVGPQLKAKVSLFWHLLALFRKIKRRENLFSEFSKLRKTKVYSIAIKIIKDYKEDKNSAFIVGSDQVWNPRFISEREDIYFLNFGSDSAKRISYAASLGMKQWPKDFEQCVLPMLQKFDAISVREESAVEYLTSLGLKNVVCVCDPTILHKGDFYREQFQGAIAESKPYAFIYKIRETIPDSVSEILPTDVKIVELQKRKSMVSVTQWLANIDHAEFVVTDSFHCAVFCILFHKSFLVIPNRSHGKGMNERFATLLGKTALEYRVLSCEESKEQVLNILNRPIDWNKIDRIMEEWRTYSGNWLKCAIEAPKTIVIYEPT